MQQLRDETGRQNLVDIFVDLIGDGAGSVAVE